MSIHYNPSSGREGAPRGDGRGGQAPRTLRKRYGIPLAGALAGAVNGIFGGGGGMALLPLLSRWSDMEEKKLFATSVAVIFPICLVSTAVYFAQTGLSLGEALPYLIGGAAGGLAGALTFQKVPVKWLKLLFAAFLLYGGARYLL